MVPVLVVAILPYSFQSQLFPHCLLYALFREIFQIEQRCFLAIIAIFEYHVCNKPAVLSFNPSILEMRNGASSLAVARRLTPFSIAEA